MEKRRWKRMLSLILSAAMIWGMSGIPAFAEGPATPAGDPSGIEMGFMEEHNAKTNSGPSIELGEEPSVNASYTEEDGSSLSAPMPLNIEDPTVKFRVTYVPHNGSDVVKYVNSGDTVYFDVGKHSFIKIVPEIEHSSAGVNNGNIFFWYRWDDPTERRTQETEGKDWEDFTFGETINTLWIREEEHARAKEDGEYYQIKIEGKNVTTSGRPSYGWDGEPVYTSGDKQFYLHVELKNSPENLYSVDAAYYDWYIENWPENYGMKQIYSSAEELIDDYLLVIFRTTTEIESDNWKTAEIGIQWKLKPGTAYSSQPGAENTFVWTGSETDFQNLGWTNTNNVPLTGKLVLHNLDQAAAPTFTPAGGTYSEPQQVTLNCATSGAEIYYTVDGTIPSPPHSRNGGTMLYTEPIEVEDDCTIQAIAVCSGMLDSPVVQADYRIRPESPTPDPDEPGNGGSGRPGSSSGGSSTYDPQAKDPDRVQVSLEARKLLDGKTPGKQEFTFTLTDEKGKVVRTAENKGGKIVFDSLALLPGTYRYTMEEVNGSGGSAFGYDDTVYEAEVFVYTSGGKYTAMVSYYQDGKELDELPTFRNTTAPAAPGTDKENPITGGGPAFPAALTAVVGLGAIAFLWRRRS